jgi:hypoxanthine phosphoribosyltransferase
MTSGFSQHILYTQDQIKTRIAELGKTISKDFSGSSLLILGVLKGSTIFLADLVRQISLEVEIDFMRVSSYSGTKSLGEVKLLLAPTIDIAGRDVLLVEDIVDTGITIDYLKEHIIRHKPKSLKVAALLHKPESQKSATPVDYIGFTISNEFVVGYGLDLNEKFRHLPHIVQLKPT